MGQGETARLIAIHTEMAQARSWKNEASPTACKLLQRFDHIGCNGPNRQSEGHGALRMDGNGPTGAKFGDRALNDGLAGCGE
jgi:hypothetical protein